jgi:hypothetical protein
MLGGLLHLLLGVDLVMLVLPLPAGRPTASS